MLAAVIDAETTNLISNSAMALKDQPHIVEFCGKIVEDDGTIVNRLNFFVNPGMKLPDDTKRITGLTDEDLKDAKPFASHAQSIENFLGQADAVVAHNLSYDFAVVNFEFERIGKTAKWPARRICTVEITKHLKGFRLSLTALHELLFGEGFPSAHRAETDVDALIRCYVELVKRGEI